MALGPGSVAFVGMNTNGTNAAETRGKQRPISAT
jgi:hypothetical protein